MQVFKNEHEQITQTIVICYLKFLLRLGTGEVGYNIGTRLAAGPNNPYGGGGHDFALTPKYFYSFDAKDLRRDVTCGTYES